MPPEVQFECAGGAVQFAKPHPPLRGPYLFCLGRKDMEEKTAGGKKKTAKEELRRNKLHIPHPVRRLRRTGVVRSVVPPFPTRIASLDSRGSLAPLQTPLKRPRRGLRPPSLDFPRGLVCAEFVFRFTKRATDAFLLNWRGSRNTLRLFQV